MTGRTGLPEQDYQYKNVKTALPEQDSQDKIAKTAMTGGTGRTGQADPDR
jgi:hypothetical protein